MSGSGDENAGGSGGGTASSSAATFGATENAEATKPAAGDLPSKNSSSASTIIAPAVTAPPTKV